MTSETKTHSQLRAELDAAGATWCPVYRTFDLPDGRSIVSVAGGHWRLFAAGQSLWTVGATPERHETLQSAVESALAPSTDVV
jgi:hypothetical protein